MDMNYVGEKTGGGTDIFHVSFQPLALPKQGALSSPVYERFDVLVNKANAWLRENSRHKAVSCETYEINLSGKNPSVDESYVVCTRLPEITLRCLRLWITPKTSGDNPEPQQIGCFTIVPNCLEAGGLFSGAKYERHGDTIARMNAMFQQQPLPGKIISVETQDMKIKTSGNPDPDSGSWLEAHGFLNAIRVFYQLGSPAYEQIGSADFIPRLVKQGTFNTDPEYEPLTNAIQEANNYIQSNPSIHLINIQALNHKLHGTKGVVEDTHRSSFTEFHLIRYVRIIRLYYTSSSAGGNVSRPYITCKTFVPHQLVDWSKFAGDPAFESQNQTMTRAQAWINATGARVIGAETTESQIEIRKAANPDNPYTLHRDDWMQYYLKVLRIYLGGSYMEPSPAALPPAPQMAPNNDCCAIL